MLYTDTYNTQKLQHLFLLFCRSSLVLKDNTIIVSTVTPKNKRKWKLSREELREMVWNRRNGRLREERKLNRRKNSSSWLFSLQFHFILVPTLKREMLAEDSICTADWKNQPFLVYKEEQTTHIFSLQRGGTSHITHVKCAIVKRHSVQLVA